MKRLVVILTGVASALAIASAEAGTRKSTGYPSSIAVLGTHAFIKGG
jgi:hypothetical protein